jgi:hypothetical protein
MMPSRVCIPFERKAELSISELLKKAPRVADMMTGQLKNDGRVARNDHPTMDLVPPVFTMGTDQMMHTTTPHCQ